MSGGQDDRPTTTEDTVMKDDERGSDSSHCYAMIVWKPVSNFTALEAAIFDNGTHEERMQVLWNVCVRVLGIPSRLVESVDTNYSSARLDYEQYKSKRFSKRRVSSKSWIDCYGEPGEAACIEIRLDSICGKCGDSCCHCWSL